MRGGQGFSGSVEKDRPSIGLRPDFLDPRTLVRTWGTRSELVCVEDWIIQERRTADPSTSLRFGRDDKGRAATFRTFSDLDGRS